VTIGIVSNKTAIVQLKYPGCKFIQIIHLPVISCLLMENDNSKSKYMATPGFELNTVITLLIRFYGTF